VGKNEGKMNTRKEISLRDGQVELSSLSLPIHIHITHSLIVVLENSTHLLTYITLLFFSHKKTGERAVKR
jgi:hypothetical protein